MMDYDAVIEDAEIRSILAPYPKAIQLYESLVGRLGPQLLIQAQSADTPFSTCNFAIDDLEYPIAVVNLTRDTEREAASLCHEFLHIKMYLDGFPIPYDWQSKVDPSDEVYKVIRHNLSAFFNAMDHLTFVDQFLALGFKQEEFLCHFECDLVESVKTLLGFYTRTDFHPYIRGIRNLFFATEYMTDCLNEDMLRSKVLAKSFRPYFAGVHSDFQSLRNWVRRGTYANGKWRVRSVQRLLRRLSGPEPLYYFLHATPEWVSLRSLPSSG